MTDDWRGWRAILYHPLGTRADKLRRTKAEAMKDAKQWRAHIASLKRKPTGVVCVVTEKKLHAMQWTCAVTPWTTPDQDQQLALTAIKECRAAEEQP